MVHNYCLHVILSVLYDTDHDQCKTISSRYQRGSRGSQEKSQEKESTTPVYKTIRETGPDHDKQFTVVVYVGNEVMGEGEGQSKQDAEQAAAKKALESKGWN